jgi:L-serine dehydratase
MNEILAYTEQRGATFWEYVVEREGERIWEHLAQVWQVMQEAIQRGIDNEGTLPGSLHLARKAAS